MPDREWSVPFVTEVPDYRIQGDTIIISVKGIDFCAFAIRTFKLGSDRAALVIKEHFAKRQLAEFDQKVVPFRRH